MALAAAAAALAGRPDPRRAQGRGGGRAEERGQLVECAAHGALFTAKVREERGLLKLNGRYQRRVWDKLQGTLPGKTLIFSDNADWSDADLMRGYRAQHHVESAFRQMKDTDCIAIRPQYHWTDQRVRVRLFCCVLTLCGLSQREVSCQGIRRSVPALLANLAGIREVDLLFPSREDGAEPPLRSTPSQMSA